MDAAISSFSAIVALIEEATGSARTVRLAELASQGLVVLEVNVTATSAADGAAVAELRLGDGDLVAAVIRAGRPMPVAGSLRLRAGDRVLVVTGPGRRRGRPQSLLPRRGSSPSLRRSAPNCYSREKATMAAPRRTAAKTATMPSSAPTGKRHPSQVTPGSSAARARGETTRCSKTVCRRGSTA